jgi:hypothetical protein
MVTSPCIIAHNYPVPSIASEYIRNREQHDRTALQWTRLYAVPPPVAPALASRHSTPSLSLPNTSAAPSIAKGKHRPLLQKSSGSSRASSVQLGDGQQSDIIEIVDDTDESTGGRILKRSHDQTLLQVKALEGAGDGGAVSQRGSKRRHINVSDSATAGTGGDDDVIVIED